jgi:hypothetical protein
MLKELYAEPALVPASPWLDESRPEKPQASYDASSRTLQLSATSDEPVARWVVQLKDGKDRTTKIIPAKQLVGVDVLREGKQLATREVRTSSGSLKVPQGITAVQTIAVDRYGNASEATELAVEQ